MAILHQKTLLPEEYSQSFQSWAACFMPFIAVKLNSPETRELVAYEKIIISMLQKMMVWAGPPTTLCSGSRQPLGLTPGPS